MISSEPLADVQAPSGADEVFVAGATTASLNTLRSPDHDSETLASPSQTFENNLRNADAMVAESRDISSVSMFEWGSADMTRAIRTVFSSTARQSSLIQMSTRESFSSASSNRSDMASSSSSDEDEKSVDGIGEVHGVDADRDGKAPPTQEVFVASLGPDELPGLTAWKLVSE
jgi:hypothetical protein